MLAFTYARMGEAGASVISVKSRLILVKIAQAQPKIPPRRIQRERVMAIIPSKQAVATATCPSDTHAATMRRFAQPCVNMLLIVKPAVSVKVNSTIKRGVQITVLGVDIVGSITGATTGNA